MFSGIWGEGSFIFRDLGRKQGFREQGAEEKHFRELGRKVIFLSGSKDPPPLEGPHRCVCVGGGGQWLQMTGALRLTYCSESESE